MSIESRGQDILYGMTRSGGMFDKGVPFLIRTDGTEYFSLKDFGGEEGEFSGDGARFTQAHQTSAFFSTGRSMAALTQDNNGYASCIQLFPNSTSVSLLYSSSLKLAKTGTNPTGGFLSSPTGEMFGLMSSNGRHGGGTLFKIAGVIGSQVTVLADFDGVNTGRSPKGTPVYGTNGALYGTTEFGGAHDLGVIFYFTSLAYEPKLGKAIDFDGVARGANPTGNLLLAPNGRLYGMTKNGGLYGHGVIFSILQDGTEYTKLLDLNGSATGSHPKGSLTLFTDGNIYGMTSSGGAYGFGTIFRISLTGTFTKVLDFDGDNGKSPVGDLLVDTHGKLMYGVTYAGGFNDQGVLFKLENGSELTKVYDFGEATGSNPVGSVTMLRKQPELTMQPITNLTTQTAPFTPLTVAEVELPVHFVSSDTSVIAVRQNKLICKKQGYAVIHAIQLGNHEYLSAKAAQGIWVTKAEQTIAFEELPTRTFGDSPLTLAATSSSGLPVAFSSSNTSIARIEGNEVKITGAGHVYIAAYQAGNSIYEPAKSVQRYLFIEKAEQTITFNPAPLRSCCDNFTLVATTSSKLPVLFKTSDPAKLRIYETSAQPLDVGKVEIIGYHPGNNNYKPTEKRASVEILKTFQTIRFSNIDQIRMKVGDPPQYVASSSSGLPVTYNADPPGIAVVEQGILYSLAEGTTTITATQPGNELYHPATPVSRTITIGPSSTPVTDNTILFPELNEKTIVDPPFNLTSRATSGLPISYTSSNQDVAEIIGNQVRIKGVGTTTITANQPGTTNIGAAIPVSRILEIKKKSQYISLPISSSVQFGSAPIALPANTSDGLPISYTLSNNALASIENSYLHFKGDGRLTITASQAGDNLHLPAFVSTTTDIIAINDNLFFKNLPPLIFGDGPVTLEAWASSGLPVTFTSSDPKIASVDGYELTIGAAGKVALVASSINPGFRVTRIQQDLVIAKKSQHIEFPPLQPKQFGDAPFNVSVSTTSGLPVAIQSLTPGVIRIDGRVVTIVGNGTAKLAASNPGDANHEPAETIIQEFLVTDVGNLYELVGTTTNGGPNQSGAVFTMDSEGKSFSYLKYFEARTSPRPRGGFIKAADGRLYATLLNGGTSAGGSVIRMEADGTGFTYLRHLSLSDGMSPTRNLVQASDGNLYGTTMKGGKYEVGTIFRMKPDGTDFSVVYNFNPFQGGAPEGGVIEASDGKLYGITAASGYYNSGVIFSINRDGSDFTIIYQLNDRALEPTGSHARGQLVEGPEGFLYGTTTAGLEVSVLFKLKKDGTEFTRVLVFDDAESTGLSVGPDLLYGSDSRFYGMTMEGGTKGQGTIFSVNADGTNFLRLHSFDDSDAGSWPPGSYPFGKLTEGQDGFLYGMTSWGGSSNKGTIFKLDKSGHAFQTLMHLDDSANSPAYGPLVESAPGTFFGMTSRGGSGDGGAIFKITSEGAFSVVIDFPEPETTPRNLTTDLTGEYYYGITKAKLETEGGSIFRVSSAGSSYEEIYKVPVGEIITSILYASTQHLWVSGMRDNESFMFRIKPDGSEREDVAAYSNLTSTPSPADYMVETAEGDIFGTTQIVTNSAAFLFRMKNDGTGLSKLSDLPERVMSEPVLGSDGNLYLACGDLGLYKATPNGFVTKIFSHPIPNDRPLVRKMIELNGGRIGVVTRRTGSAGVTGARNRGSIFSIERDGSDYREIYEFKSNENASPVDMLQTVDGWLYVVSQSGGIHKKGLIFKVRPDGSSYKEVREFNGDDGEDPNRIFFRRGFQSFTFDALTEKLTSDPAFSPSISSTSGAPVHLSSSNPAVAIIQNGQIKPVGAGTTTIVATLLANANFYEGGRMEQLLVVNKGNQTLSFENIPTKNLKEGTLHLTASASSGLPVSYTSSNPAIASVDGSTVTFHTIGNTIITASQAGDANFFSAPNISRVLSIIDDTQTITFIQPAGRVLGDAPFYLNAIASSGLPVTYTTDSDEISIEGALVTIHKSGRVTVQATQEGNDDFKPAIPVQVTFCINPPKPVITESGQYPEVVFHSSNDAGNQWYHNDTAISGTTGNSISVAEEGTYTVVTTIEGCVGEISAPMVFLTTAIEEQLSNQIIVFPNPFVDDLHIEIGGGSGIAVVELLDAIGRQLDVKELHKPATTKFDVSRYRTGILLVKITVDGRTVMKKIVNK